MEQSFELDHSSVHRCVIKLASLLETAILQHKRPLGKGGRWGEVNVKINGIVCCPVDKETGSITC